MHRPFVGGVLLVAIASTLPSRRRARARRRGTHPVSGDWLSWGRTLDQNRHSPLTQITRANVGELGRVFTVDFRAIDATMLRGPAVVPLAVGGRHLRDDRPTTTSSRSTATNGEVIWRYKPANIALFANFGIRANRGVAYCDGRVFLATLDMHLVALDAGDRARLLQRVPVDVATSRARRRTTATGQTSAPICANGPRRDRRGRLRVRHPRLRDGLATDLTPAWPNPYWTIPPDGRRVAQARDGSSAAARSGRRSRSTARRTPSTSAPARRRRSTTRAAARPEPAHRLADRGRPAHRPPEVVAAADGAQRVGVRHRAAAARLRRAGRRPDAPRSSRWRRWRASGSPYDAAHRRADLPARQGARPRRAPALKPGEPVDGLSRRRSAASTTRPPRSTRRRTSIINAAAETAGVLIAGAAHADAEAAQAARRRLPRARRTATSAPLCPAGGTTARSARSTSTPAGASGSSGRPSRSAAA